VLGLGKHGGGIELELRTPKNPNLTETFKETKYVQVFEADFENIAPVTKIETVVQKKAVAVKDKKGKKGKKVKK
jgi:hypothetical protein